MVLRTVLTGVGPISLNTARPVNTVQPRTTVNNAGPMKNVNTVKGTRVNTARPKAILSAVKENKGNVIKASACWVWRPKHKVLDHGNPQQDLKDKGVIDSGCSRHMTGNRSYLTDYEEIDGEFVTFRGNSKGRKITRKGKIRTGKLDFKDLYFVKELKFNLFSVSQTCDKKNSVLFTNTECVVLSPDFKLTDESHVLLKVPKKDNMYSVDLKNVVPQRGLTCLFAKATPDESNLWHKRLGHVNFKTMNNLVRGNLIRGLPLKLFEINETCIACQKGKQNRASYPSFSSSPKDSSDAGFKPSGEEEMKDVEDPGNEGGIPSIEEPRINQEKDASVNSTNNINTVSPTVNAASIEDNAIDENIVYGCADDPNIPDLEEIGRFSNAKNDDSGADKNNLDTYFQVSLVPITRIHKDHPLNQVIGDLQSATQTRQITKNLEEYGFLQEVWTLVELPNEKRGIGTKWVFRNKKDERGIVIENKERLVAQGYTQEEGIDYDEVFAPVARIKAIRLFLAYVSFKDFMVYQMDVNSAFLYSKIEEEVYVCQPPGFEDPDFPDRVYKVEKALYGLHQAPRAWYETLSTYLLENRFQRGQIDKTLFIKRDQGLQVKQKEDGIFISQDKYVTEILKKFGFSNVKTANTPMETHKPLLKDANGEDVDEHMYRSMIGSLMYLTSSRPDIMFTDSPFDLVAYTDSDYVGASLDRKSTTGGCQFLRCRLISWQCKKQTVVANSTTEAEYVAASSCYGQVLWIQNQLLDYGYNFMHTKIYIDNESTICIVKNLVFHSKTKHIEIRHHFIRDSIEKKLIQMIKIHTDKNVVDLLTKAFDKGIGVNADDSKLMLLGINLLLLEKVNAARHNLLLLVLKVNAVRHTLLLLANVNAVEGLQALMDGKKVIITETSVRRDLQLEDAK
ncbi:putative ribonuclease H-like domain-containing protein [Tanacetum coccineum]